MRQSPAGTAGFRQTTGPREMTILRAAKDRQRIVHRNAGASLVDLGDGVLGERMAIVRIQRALKTGTTLGN